MPKIEVFNCGQYGVVKDIPPHYLPPEAWTDANNMRFQDRNAAKIKGHSRIFDPPSVAPSFLLPVPSATTTYWIYTSLTKAYVYESSVHTNITRQTASVDVDYTAVNHRDWNGGILGGVPILNNGADVPQYWPSINVATKLTALTNWPSTLRAKIVRPYGPFLVALNINDNSNLYPHMFWWSHPADPGTIPASWDYSNPIYDAGRKELTDAEGGPIVDALMLKNLLIIYKESSIHYMRYIGGQEIMANDLLFPGTGIIAPRCVCLINRGKEHFVVTSNDVLVHDSQKIESILDSRARKYLQTDIDPTNFRNSFAMHNPAQREAWFCYPSTGATLPDKALIWNYQESTLQFRDFVGIFGTPGNVDETDAVAWSAASQTWALNESQWSEEGRKQLVIADTTNTRLYKADDSYLFDTTAINSYLERTGLAVMSKDRAGAPKADYTSRKLAKRIWPKITGTAPVTVRVGAQEDFDDTVVWSDAQVFTPGTDKYLDITANGRLIAVRFESNTEAAWQLEGYDIDVEILGEQ